MGPPVLTYFNARGRCELTRYLLAEAGVKYEDKRIEKEDWIKLKPETPLGFLPMYEVDGVKINQSLAIARYVAHTQNLYGTSPIERAKIDMVTDTCNELTELFYRLMFMPAGPEKEKAEKETSEKIVVILANLEKLKVANNGNFFVGKKASLADFASMNSMTALKLEEEGKLAAYPALLKHSHDIQALPKIKAWIDKRPQSTI